MPQSEARDWVATEVRQRTEPVEGGRLVDASGVPEAKPARRGGVVGDFGSLAQDGVYVAVSGDQPWVGILTDYRDDDARCQRRAEFWFDPCDARRIAAALVKAAKIQEGAGE